MTFGVRAVVRDLASALRAPVQDAPRLLGILFFLFFAFLGAAGHCCIRVSFRLSPSYYYYNNNYNYYWCMWVFTLYELQHRTLCVRIWSLPNRNDNHHHLSPSPFPLSHSLHCSDFYSLPLPTTNSLLLLLLLRETTPIPLLSHPHLLTYTLPTYNLYTSAMLSIVFKPLDVTRGAGLEEAAVRLDVPLDGVLGADVRAQLVSRAELDGCTPYLYVESAEQPELCADAGVPTTMDARVEQQGGAGLVVPGVVPRRELVALPTNVSTAELLRLTGGCDAAGVVTVYYTVENQYGCFCGRLCRLLCFPVHYICGCRCMRHESSDEPANNNRGGATADAPPSAKNSSKTVQGEVLECRV